MVGCNINFILGELQHDYQTGVVQMLVHHSTSCVSPKMNFLLRDFFTKWHLLKGGNT